MSSLATPADADLILKLYDLRRESVMREARNFIAGFNPTSADEVVKLFNSFGTKENAYLRQTTSFWEMAASLVLHGALHEGLFVDNANEMFFIFSKFQPFVAEIREKLGSPSFLANTEKLIQHTSESQAKLHAVIERHKRIAHAAK